MSNKPDFDAGLNALDENPDNDLSQFLEGDDKISEHWEDHWKGMPEFEQENKNPYKKLNVCFQTKEDFVKFRELMDQPMTEKTKTIWYPAFEREANSLFSWVEDDE